MVITISDFRNGINLLVKIYCKIGKNLFSVVRSLPKGFLWKKPVS